MRYAILTLFMGLITGMGIVNAQDTPFVTTADSVTVTTVENIAIVYSPNISDMPILDFPPGAKICRWWPNTDTHYFMPNALDTGVVKKRRADPNEKPEREGK